MKLRLFPYLLFLMLLNACASPPASIWVRFQGDRGPVPTLQDFKSFLEARGFACREISIEHESGSCSLVKADQDISDIGYKMYGNDLVVQFQHWSTYIVLIRQPKYDKGFLEEFSVLLDDLKFEGADVIEFSQFFDPGNPERPWHVFSLDDFSVEMLNMRLPHGE